MKILIKILLLLLFTASMCQAAAINGSIQFAHQIESSLPVSGTVEMINASPGQSIQKGETLLRLNELPFSSAVVEASSKLQLTTADHIEATRDLNHAKELYDRGVFSTVSLQKAKLNESRADANVKSAEANLATAKYWLQNSAIISPFDGWVLNVNVKQGQSINNSLSTQSMMTLAEANWYTAKFALSLNSIKSVKLAKSINVKVAGKSYPGAVISTGLEPLHSSIGAKARYEIHIKFNSKGKLLRPGEVATISLPN